MGSFISTPTMLWLLLLAAVFVTGTGGDTTPAPYENACEPTGMTPYDYSQVLCMSFLFYEAQRSGPLPADQRVTWRGDSALDDGSDVGHDLTGGYFDAGDHVKFGFPLAYTATVLAWGALEYKEGYVKAGQLEYAHAAIKWVTDYLLKAHTGPFELYGQVGDGDADHSYWGRPEDMNMTRPAFKIDGDHGGSELAGETAAALAAAYLVFKDSDQNYADEMLAAAREIYEFADQVREKYDVSIPEAANFYGSWGGYGDELTWASLWLYYATGESIYLEDAKQHWDEFGLGDGNTGGFGWSDKSGGAYVLMAQLDGGSEYLSVLESYMDGIINDSPYIPGGMVFINEWGSLRHANNVAFIALRAADLGINPESYREFAKSQIDFTLGSSGHSFVVGYGVNPPQRPHHRSSSCPDPPSVCDFEWAFNQPGPNPQVLYGGLVGGPDQDGNWEDDRGDYQRNEVACDYNAAFTGVLAAMTDLNSQ